MHLIFLLIVSETSLALFSAVANKKLDGMLLTD